MHVQRASIARMPDSKRPFTFNDPDMHERIVAAAEKAANSIAFEFEGSDPGLAAAARLVQGMAYVKHGFRKRSEGRMGFVIGLVLMSVLGACLMVSLIVDDAIRRAKGGSHGMA